MQIGQRLHELREAKNFSQGEIERRAGRLRPRISPVDNGHTSPSLETIENFARALDASAYQLIIGLDVEPDGARRALRNSDRGNSLGKSPKERSYLMQSWRLLGRMSKGDHSALDSPAIVLSKR